MTATESAGPAEPAEAVVRGLAGILERADLAPGDVGLLVHGTTLGLNTIIQRQGARLALVSTDLSEWGSGRRWDEACAFGAQREVRSH